MIDNQRKTGSSHMPAVGVQQSAGDQHDKNNAGLPSISLPKGGAAIRGIGEKFTANPVTGTGSMTVPIAVSPGRSGFGPQLALSYDSGGGNGQFGFGWKLSLPAITRKTDRGLPRYDDSQESDEFVLSGAEDLVPAPAHAPDQDGYRIRRYRPRVESLFARIERWTSVVHPEDVHWRSISKDNVISIYGKDANSRITDPAKPDRIFSWLICETRDDKGNGAVYTYKEEDGIGVDLTRTQEMNRGPRTAVERTANRYLKRIRYGNRIMLLEPDGVRPRVLTQTQIDAMHWMFEVVFDYGEHDDSNPTPGDAGGWHPRKDPFSSYRAGFEVRTQRLCRRILMFHHFPSEPEVGQDCLVRSTDLTYRETPLASFLTAVTQCGYKRASAVNYQKDSMPPLEFGYSEPVIGTEVRTVDAESLANLPYGADGSNYQWIDLDGEGLAGILTAQGDGWFYKRNESPLTRDLDTDTYSARFAPVEQVMSLPSNRDMKTGTWQFLDLAGDGQMDLVALEAPVAGFYERANDQGWETFRVFRSSANLTWKGEDLRFSDLTGDGRTDVLIAEDRGFTWHASLSEDGFGPANLVDIPWDEERGPHVLFFDGTHSIFLADFSGDGLADIVRIRNGEICYWPNLGYGRFGAKITMDSAPWFDTPDQFDPRQIRLADIDGSGVTDIIYLGRGNPRFWLNESGNAWSEAHEIAGFPVIDNIASVTAADLFGNGTACLVWSSPMPGEAFAPMKYLALMAKGKPHLLVRAANNLGAETRVQYAPSTYFYLRDKAAGRPWITRLPFPVHVVERVETYDYISRNRFVSRFAYHHGHYDGEEREFAGFGMVEQWDTESFAALSGASAFPAAENIEAVSHVPPLYTKTWFHTGVFLGSTQVSNFFSGLGDQEGEYYREPAWRNDDAEAARRLLDDTVLPDKWLKDDGTRSDIELTPNEQREACRALRGAMLRQEVYARDGSPKQEHPYTVTEQNFTVELLQPQEDRANAVFFAHPRETISYQYERDPTDPRVAHGVTLEVDAFGNVLGSVSIGYGRRQADLDIADATDREEQTRIHIVSTENRYTKPVIQANALRAPLPSEVRGYEITGRDLPGSALRFTFAQVADIVQSATEIAYEVVPTADVLQKRLVECVRSYYRRDDLSGPMALHEIQSLGLPFETYYLAFTPRLLTETFGSRVNSAMLQAEAGYVHTEGDVNWWIPSGREFYSPSVADNAEQELAFARSHFFLPHRFRDPFHTTAVPTESTVTYDEYNLLLLETRSALGNRITAGERNINGALVKKGNDYRVLQPRLVMDSNRNRTEMAFDSLGLVDASATRGKPEENQGDSLDTPLPAINALAVIAQPLAAPQSVLGQATARMIYDLFAYQRTKNQPDPQPAVVYSLTRETHGSDLEPGQQTKFQHSLAYSDGFGREIQVKVRAEAESVNGAPVPSRWVATGWTIFNNKGKPVWQYEPFFTPISAFEFGRQVGVSAVLFYDPAERVAAKLYPDHTYEKVTFNPWRQDTWDANDTVEGDPRSDPDIRGFTERYFAALGGAPGDWKTWREQRLTKAPGDPERVAAEKTSAHARTPETTYFDSLGRPFLTLGHNGFKPDGAAIHFSRRVELDIGGNAKVVRDAESRVVMRYDYDIAGNGIHQTSMEAGERWTLYDVFAMPIRSWDSRGHSFRVEFDRLRRPVRSFVAGADPLNPAAELLTERMVYGEQHPDAESLNLRDQVYLNLDQAGAVISNSRDFKGNPLSASRSLAKEYKQAFGWSGVDAAIPHNGADVFDPDVLYAALKLLLEPEVYLSSSAFDALNRTVTLTAPHRAGMPSTVLRPSYNEANLLEKMDVNLRGATAAGQPVWTPFVTSIDYDAKGRRTRVDYGNSAATFYEYDSLTFRLTRVRTRRHPVSFPGDCPQPVPAGWPGCQAQDLRYTYDPIGNITHLRDLAQQTIYFRNKRVEPTAEYTYDPVYRLIEASGREHLGQGGIPIPHSHNDLPRVAINWAANDGNAMGAYIEHYLYDAVGNMLEMQHRGSDPAHPGWKRAFTYDQNSQIEDGFFGRPLRKSNQLTSSQVSMGNPPPDRYRYDVHGNMTRVPHLGGAHPAPNLEWDQRDQLRRAELGGGGSAYFTYDATGRRVRKVWEKTATLIEERFYFGMFEIFRRRNAAGTVALERETLHVMDDQRRVASVESRTMDAAGDDPGPAQLIRYQFGNHLGSAMLELDAEAQIISYEEYTPYGSTSYQAVRSQLETSKRYRYSGKERDEETGFYYHGARYFAPWLARWTSCDPAGLAGGINLYSYCSANPVNIVDRSGHQGTRTLEDYRSMNARRNTPLSDQQVSQAFQADRRVRKPPSKANTAKPSESTKSGTAPNKTGTAPTPTPTTPTPKAPSPPPKSGSPPGDPTRTGQVPEGKPEGKDDGSQEGKPTGDPSGTNLKGTGNSKYGGTNTNLVGGHGDLKNQETAKNEMDYGTLLASQLDPPFVDSIVEFLAGKPKESVMSGGLTMGTGSASNASEAAQAGFIFVNLIFTFIGELTAAYKSIKGHHIHQSAAYSKSGVSSAKGNPNHGDALSIQLEGPLHNNASSVQRNVNRAVRGKSYQNKIGDASAGQVEVRIEAKGDGKLVTPSQPLEDVKAFYALRSAGYGPNQAYGLVDLSSKQIAKAGVNPVRVPSR
jgi:RHS repeat-associated protein